MTRYNISAIPPARDCEQTLRQVFGEIETFLTSMGMERDFEHERMTHEHLSQYGSDDMDRRTYILKELWEVVFLWFDEKKRVVTVSTTEGFEETRARVEELVAFLDARARDSGLVLARSLSPADQAIAEAEADNGE